ncbi:MAG: aldehyde ferredoxin oxidoreductase [Desulfobacterota bacterium]|nr:aldehyde ferredoxin oxidoreductase [Thermodesulfobacteriota bacterium]MDW8002090.1 aldehyde ferredoxin oxidoreductase C-terminal domain-containing protein [Deltaproteobacteria bacterium]
MGKILRVNLSKKKVEYEELPEKYAGFGGRGLTSKIVLDEVPPLAHPLGDENKLIFAHGLLAGTLVPNNGRLSIGAKSPLTRTIKEANSGGSAAQKLARLGISALIVEGRSEEMVTVKINKDGCFISEAHSLKGLGNYDCIERLRREHGENVSIISIGLAGEMQLLASSIAVTTPDFKIRMASRGGLGAVMGSKNLKAIIIDDSDTSPVEVKDQEKLKIAVSQLTKGILSHPLAEGLKLFGTPLLVMMINNAGALPTKNYSMGSFEYAEKISGESLAQILDERPKGVKTHRCMSGCIISCSNIYTDENGNEIVSGLEYETIGMIGSNCMIGSLDEIAMINRLLNDLGLDTMEVGAALGCAMEAGFIGWGEGKKVLSLLEGIRKGSKDGIMLANGCLVTGKSLGVKRIPQVKGQSLAAYDPRVLKGTGVTYATSPMGADHTCGNALPSPANPDYNPTSSTGQGQISSFLQRYFAAIDTLGLCLFASLPLLDSPELQKHLVDCVSAITGRTLEENYLLELGKEVLKTERKFNELAGFTRKDDRLPEFFLKERLPGAETVFDVPEEELDMVFDF